jgi:hypothetical protein
MLKQTIYIIFAIIFFQFIISCEEGNSRKTKYCITIDKISTSKWRQLSQKKIYFGHQSVGNNIINGIMDIMRENPKVQLNIIRTSNKPNFVSGVLFHTRISGETNPKSLLIEYKRDVDKLMGGNADIALLRFSHSLIKGDTNVESVFNDYQLKMSMLKQKYPNTIFIHSTLPLLRSKTTWKTIIKKLIGKKEIWEYDINIKLNKFNDLLLREYVDKQPVIDLAKLQSTFPDGSLSTFTKNGKTYFNMVPDYTYDDMHLNKEARKLAAEQFLLFLISVI